MKYYWVFYVTKKIYIFGRYNVKVIDYWVFCVTKKTNFFQGII